MWPCMYYPAGQTPFDWVEHSCADWDWTLHPAERNVTSTGIPLPGSLGRGPLQEEGCCEMHKFRACMDYCKCMPCGGEGWISHNPHSSENAVAALGQGLAVHPTLASNFQPYFQHMVITGVHVPHPGKSYLHTSIPMEKTVTYPEPTLGKTQVFWFRP